MFGNANRRRFLLPRRGLVLVVGTTMDLRMLFALLLELLHGAEDWKGRGQEIRRWA